MIKTPMLAKPVNMNVIHKKWPLSIIAQPKIDGHRCTYQQGALWSRGGKEIVSVPHILEQLREADAPDGLDGELWVPGCTHQQVSTLTRCQYVPPGSRKVQYHVFDLMRDIPCLDRLMKLNIWELTVRGTDIHLVPSTHLPVDKIEDKLREYIACDWEGIILRNPTALYQHKRTSDLMKIKPMEYDTYSIVGYEEEVSIEGKPKGTLGALRCVTTGEMEAGEFKVGTGFTRQQRHTYWNERESLIGRSITVKYQYLTERGVPCHPVVMEIQDREDA